MPRRKKTRTTFTERPPIFDGDSAAVPRSVRKVQQLRRDIAAEAARIMATEAQRNYRTAKQKAAARIGVNSRLALPSNREIESALRAYQGFYGGDQHGRQLDLLRQAAIRVMRALDAFCPRLVGPVLDGTADRYSRVSLHLFSDPTDEVLLILNERGISYRQEERSIRWHDGGHRRIPVLVTEADGTAVELALFSRKDLRQAPPCPIDGQPQRRAPLAEVECLLAGA
jgi:hypothetical protein